MIVPLGPLNDVVKTNLFLVPAIFVTLMLCFFPSSLLDIEIIERAVKSSIEDRIRVNRYTVTAWELPTATSIVPDETYPVENIHIIDIKRGNKIISR